MDMKLTQSLYVYSQVLLRVIQRNHPIFLVDDVHSCTKLQHEFLWTPDHDHHHHPTPRTHVLYTMRTLISFSIMSHQWTRLPPSDHLKGIGQSYQCGCRG